MTDSPTSDSVQAIQTDASQAPLRSQSSSRPLDTPVLFLIFNRPDLTRQVFQSIRDARPRKLFIAADGPRANRKGEREKCELTRKFATEVDWDCEVHTLFRDKNMGCRPAVQEALHWFFEHVEEGIILEDDCLPSGSFFTFCEQMLQHYRHDDTVMHVAGNSYVESNGYHPEASYYFSNYSATWGWATWRRAFKHYDGELKGFGWPFMLNQLRKVCQSLEEFIYWRNKFHGMKTQPGVFATTWDYQWIFTVWAQRGSAVVPSVNLIKNIGIGSVDSTHFVEGSWEYANMPLREIDAITHPASRQVDRRADQIFFQECSQGKNMPSWWMYFYYSLANRVKKALNK